MDCILDEYIPPLPREAGCNKPKAKSKRKSRRAHNAKAEPTFDDFAASGDLEALLDSFSSAEGDSITSNGKMRLIRKALDTCAKDGLGSLMDTSLKTMIRFAMTQFCMGEVLCRTKIRRYQENSGSAIEVPDIVAKEDLPRLVGIQNSVVALLKTAATVRHLERLAGEEVKQPCRPTESAEAMPIPGTVPIDGNNRFGVVMVPRTVKDEERMRQCGWEKVGEDEWWRGTPTGPNSISVEKIKVPQNHAAAV